MERSRNFTLAIHWPRFGPYHITRLEWASQGLAEKGINVIGLEIAREDDTYGWDVIGESTNFQRYIACPNGLYENLSVYTIVRNTWRLFNSLKPDIVAITGYSSWDARTILSWCRFYRRPAILMMESKYDDAPRTASREVFKNYIVGQYNSALCGGTLHKLYLEKLGMDSQRIFFGYDVIDNSYFHLESIRVRQNPNKYRHLPGLSTSQPFFLASARFIPRKNIDGLILAYEIYREQATINNIPPWRLVVLGDGVERNNLEELIAKRDIEGITLAGFRQIDELPAYYGLASVFIHPAFQEQWGLVVNEAMASELPVIVSKTCGCAPDLIVDGRNGFIFDPNDMPSLALLMLKCTTQTINLQEMGRNGFDQISRWGPEQFIEGMLCAVKAAIRDRI